MGEQVKLKEIAKTGRKRERGGECKPDVLGEGAITQGQPMTISYCFSTYQQNWKHYGEQGYL